jgi:tryptophan synthase alpha subunit
MILLPDERQGEIWTAEIADGIAVGTRAVEVAEEGPRALASYVRGLREALDAA